MRYLTIVTILVLILQFNGFISGASASSSRFWIGFIGSSGGEYLQQIDENGTALNAPAQLHGLGFNDPDALSWKGLDAFNLWLINEKTAHAFVSRIVINKNTLTRMGFIRTRVVGSQGFNILRVTHRRSDNLISFTKDIPEGKEVHAYPLDDSGRIQGSGWSLSPAFPSDCSDTFCTGGVSGDGRLAYWTIQSSLNVLETDLYFQQLDLSGRPNMPPVLAAKAVAANDFGSSAYFVSADFSSELQGQTRYAIYVKSHNRNLQGPTDTMFLCKINSRTGEVLGDAIFLRYGATYARIDPMGRFVVYMSASSNFSRLLYQALDSTGHTSGAPKVIATQVAGVVDLLPEPPLP